MTYLFSNTSSIFQSNGSAITEVNPLPVTLGSSNINIIGNISIPTTVNVASSPEDPVHVHITEIGTSGNLLANNVSYMPIGGDITGNVIITSGNIDANVTGTVTVSSITSNVNVTQATSPWIVSGNSTISGGNINVSNLPDVSVTAFEEPLAVGITPVIQGSAVYGLDPDFWNQSVLRGGTISTTPYSLFQVASGTSPGGYARLATTSYVTYQPGEGMMFRWTAAFTTTADANATTKNATGITSIVQNTGPIDRENGFSIGYSGVAGTKIGILHRRAGFVETRQLTVTTAPTGAQTANVTLNGTSFSINLTTSTSTQYTAAQIAQQLKLNATADNLWDIEACDSIVTFVYYTPGPQNGAYSFSSAGSGTLAAASFSQLQAGSSPIDTWTYIDQWNGNVPASFDPTKLNVYGMDLRWLGAGRIRFFMEDPTTGKINLIHTITWTKDQTGLYPHVRNPALRIIYRSGTTNPAITPSTNVIVSGASIFGAIQGEIIQSGMSQGYYNTDSTNRAQNVVHHLMSLQNPFTRNGLVNKSSLIIQDLTVSAQGNDPSVIFVIKNPVSASDLIVFNPIPNNNPYYFAQYSTSVVSANISLESPANIQTLGINSSAAFDLKPYNLTLNPGDIVSVFFISTSQVSRTAVGMTWRVD